MESQIRERAVAMTDTITVEQAVAAFKKSVRNPVVYMGHSRDIHERRFLEALEELSKLSKDETPVVDCSAFIYLHGARHNCTGVHSAEGKHLALDSTKENIVHVEWWSMELSKVETCVCGFAPDDPIHVNPEWVWFHKFGSRLKDETIKERAMECRMADIHEWESIQRCIHCGLMRIAANEITRDSPSEPNSEPMIAGRWPDGTPVFASPAPKSEQSAYIHAERMSQCGHCHPEKFGTALDCPCVCHGAPKSEPTPESIGTLVCVCGHDHSFALKWEDRHCTAINCDCRDYRPAPKSDVPAQETAGLSDDELTREDLLSMVGIMRAQFADFKVMAFAPDGQTWRSKYDRLTASQSEPSAQERFPIYGNCNGRLCGNLEAIGKLQAEIARLRQPSTEQEKGS